MFLNEQCEATLRYYERLANNAQEWSNQVPRAIRAWYAAKAAAPTEQEVKDAARLDWLEKHPKAITPVVRLAPEFGPRGKWGFAYPPGTTYESLRAAIDAAMSRARERK